MKSPFFFHEIGSFWLLLVCLVRVFIDFIDIFKGTAFSCSVFLGCLFH